MNFLVVTLPCSLCHSATNVDVTILIVDESDAPVPDAKIRILDIRSGGATEFAMAFSGLNGVAKLPVPNDASIIVVASKDKYTTTSTTYDVQSDESKSGRCLNRIR